MLRGIDFKATHLGVRRDSTKSNHQLKITFPLEKENSWFYTWERGYATLGKHNRF